MKMRAVLVSAALAVLAGPATASADDAACNAMKATLAPRQAEVADLTAKRDASAILVERTGEAWEDVEAHRRVSERYAAVADREKATYESAREQLARDEMALQAVLNQYNADIAMFNARCTKN